MSLIIENVTHIPLFKTNVYFYLLDFLMLNECTKCYKKKKKLIDLIASLITHVLSANFESNTFKSLTKHCIQKKKS